MSAARDSLRRAAKAATGPYDIFLSHSVLDARIILGVRNWLVLNGYSVYVDWIDDPMLDRTTVSPATAARLRSQMKRSKFMIYATSRAADTSRWMPWELGYFDGIHAEGVVAVLPIDSSRTAPYAGQEYLGLYRRLETLPQIGGGYGPALVDPAGHPTSLKSAVRGWVP